jgi:predicted alpha/beta hydrolase family esterase
MGRCIIVHGWAGKPEEGWMPWLANELIGRGWQVQVPVMPHAKLPKLDQWLEMLDQTVGTTDQDVYFVGHSLGCYTFLKFIERLAPQIKVGGGVMVAGFAGHLKHNIPVLQKFYEEGLDWEKIRQHDGRYAAVYSENDDWVRVESALEFNKHLGATLVKNNDWEHFSGSEGITELPDALTALLQIAGEKPVSAS